MTLTWHGLSCFRIQKDGATVLTDPRFAGTGLRGPRLAANLILFGNRENVPKLDLGSATPAPRVVTGPGEYEAGGILVEGTAVPLGGAHTCYRIMVDGIIIIVLGALAAAPSAEAVAALTGGDILLVPVGGKPVLSGAEAAHLVSVLEPRIVVPCYFRLPGLTVKLDPLDKFCKEIGVCPTEAVPKLKASRKDLPAGEMKVVVLEKA